MPLVEAFRGDLTTQELCRRGRLKLRRFDPPGYAEAVAFFSDAREGDPECAVSVAALAEAYSHWGFARKLIGQESESYFLLAFENACLALEMAPELAETHRAMAVCLRHRPRRGPEQGLAEASAAVRINPYDAMSCYELWRAMGHDPESPMIHKALALDPALLTVNNDLAVSLMEAERAQEAGFHLRQCLRVNYENAVARYNMVLLLACRGKTEQAQTLLEAWLKGPDFEPLVRSGNASLADPRSTGGILL
ncbi:MAG: hypothetical protein HY924_09045 [Elusimicrobia bacterium]|nr:hypothetical protein [Elusimicrobiota bacterium]